MAYPIFRRCGGDFRSSWPLSVCFFPILEMVLGIPTPELPLGRSRVISGALTEMRLVGDRRMLE